MAAIAGYKSLVRIGGTATAFTGEATTDAGDHKTYQITDATKRVWDPNTPPAVKKNGSAASAALYTVDYLFGRVTFTSALLNTDVVTIDGDYLPMYTVATARDLGYQIGADLIDNTTYASAQANGGEKSRIYGLQDASGSIEVLEDMLTDHDSSGDSRTLYDVLTGGTVVMLEVYQSTAEKFRAFVAFESGAVKAALADQVTSSIPWKLAGFAGKAYFAVGT